MISINKLPRARVVFFWGGGGRKGQAALTWRICENEGISRADTRYLFFLSFFLFSFLFLSIHARDVRDFIDRKYARSRAEDKFARNVYNYYIREAEERTTDPFR